MLPTLLKLVEATFLEYFSRTRLGSTRECAHLVAVLAKRFSSGLNRSWLRLVSHFVEPLGLELGSQFLLNPNRVVVESAYVGLHVLHFNAQALFRNFVGRVEQLLEGLPLVNFILSLVVCPLLCGKDLI